MIARRRRKRTLRDLVLIIVRRHGPLDDRRLAAIMRSIWSTPDSSARGRRAELVRLGRLEKVGTTQDGRGRFDVARIRRQPAAPLEQKQLF